VRRELERGLVAAMTDLVLQRTGSSTQYEVIAEDEIVGRISLVGALQNKPWMWSIDFTFSEGHEPLYGFEATREAAMQSFAKSWFRD
jgi:hypothetical protein